MEITRLTIIVPVYNEAGTVGDILKKINEVKLTGGIEKEVIVINDGSTDDSGRVIQACRNAMPELNIRYMEHKTNRGKGAALHTGIANANGEYLLIQDADLEYDPLEYNDLLKPVYNGFADVVYGSRFMGSNPHRILFFWHTIGNKWLTLLANLFANLNLTDVETCYKLFNTEMIRHINLIEQRFGFEPEVTLKMARIPGIRIYEVGISYYGRTYNEGKKIKWKDGFRAMYCIFKYGLLKMG